MTNLAKFHLIYNDACYKLPDYQTLKSARLQITEPANHLGLHHLFGIIFFVVAAMNLDYPGDDEVDEDTPRPSAGKLEMVA